MIYSTPRFLLAALLLGTGAQVAEAAPPVPVSKFYAAHAQDKILWNSWGPEAFAKARASGKPIYVFAGSATSELSRAMHIQSFVNPQIIALLNDEFVPVLVDRDERPDLALFLQSYLSANKQLSGWPANVWFTPDLKPFDGSTYLPPSQEWGKEGILNVMQRIVGQWKANRADVQQRGVDGLSGIRASEITEPGPTWDAAKARELLNKGLASWLEHYDAKNHGFGESPRFLEPELLRALLAEGGPGRDAALQSLRTVASSAMHDVLEGGFYHRCVDPAWELPSFQKFTSDQARLALAYLDAANVSNDPVYRDVADFTLRYLQSTFSETNGLPTRALDYTAEATAASLAWTTADLGKWLGSGAPSFEKAFRVTEAGTISAENDPSAKWKGKSLLAGDAFNTFAKERATLLKARRERALPEVDSHTFVGDAALTAEAFSRGTTVLKNPALQKIATEILRRLHDTAWNSTTLTLSREPGTALPATPEEYAAILQSLALLPRDIAWAKTWASEIQKALESRFLDKTTGRFFATATPLADFGLQLHASDPSQGDGHSAETAAILGLHSQNATVPAGLLATLLAQLDDPAGQPRGDVLLTASTVLSPSAK